MPFLQNSVSNKNPDKYVLYKYKYELYNNSDANNSGWTKFTEQ